MKYVIKQTPSKYLLIEVSTNAVITTINTHDGYMAVDRLYMKLHRMNK